MLKKILLGLLGLVLVVGAGAYIYYRLFIFQPPAISDSDRESITLMPLPASLELGGKSLLIREDFGITFENYSDERLQKAADRFLNRLSKRSGIEFTRGDELTLTINCLSGSDSQIQKVEEDESYKLRIETGSIILESTTPYGTLRGLETLLQLLIVEESGSSFPTAVIKDHPRFPWRGLMIDASRHWMPKQVILRNLNAMASVKMNVLHLHLSDDQGFRVESKIYPRLHEIGSNGKYYTQDDIKEIIAYAADRGIRIVPEFDVPGHTKSWQMAYPELSTVSYPLSFGSARNEFFPPPLDPTKPEVYDFLDKFIEEMAGLFPDPYFHIGGDEVNPKFWDESDEIQQYMVENNLANSKDLQAHFNYRVDQIIKKHGKIMIGWEEIRHDDLSEEVVIQSWKSHKTLFESVQEGRSAILSTGLYLDHKLSSDKHYSVDPLVLPGAVDIVPDYENWKMYDVKIELPGNTMDGQMVLFDKDPGNAYGYFAFLEDRNAFINATISEGILSFDLNTPIAELEFEALISGDSLNGNLSLGFMKLAAYGTKTGGSDMEGTVMPKIEIIKPLTEEEESRILGVEAAIWSEVVSNRTIDSRIWPRTAAIAEKAWSPTSLTTNVEDMYRRLEIISLNLSEEGSIHSKMYYFMLRDLGDQEGYKPVKILFDVLEEVKYYNRLTTLLTMDSLYLPDLVLDHAADVARPESLEARNFNKLVGQYIENNNEDLKIMLSNQLEIWSDNHEMLSRYITDGSRLTEIDSLSKSFSEVSGVILGLDSGMKLTESDMSSVLLQLDYLETGDNGVLVAVAPGLRKLVFASLNAE